MSERRSLRLLALVLVLVGTLGTVAALTGLMGGTDGTAAFPASVVIGIVVLVKNRPRKRRWPRA